MEKIDTTHIKSQVFQNISIAIITSWLMLVADLCQIDNISLVDITA